MRNDDAVVEASGSRSRLFLEARTRLMVHSISELREQSQ